MKTQKTTDIVIKYSSSSPIYTKLLFVVGNTIHTLMQKQKEIDGWMKSIVAPEGSKSFNSSSSENVLVVECSHGSPNQWSNPENPLIYATYI